MILLGNFLIAVGHVLNTVIWLFIILLIARAVLSWVSPDPSNVIVRFIYDATEPVLIKARRFIPPLGMLDLSVIVLLLILFFLQAFLVTSMLQYGGSFVAAGIRG